MLTRLIQIATDQWLRLTLRERAMSVAVLALLVIMVALMTYRGAMDRLDAMDRTIDRLQQDIVNYHYQMARRQSVEAQYNRVAAQHSSRWSEAEIHDRLRAEIYRLAQKIPPPLGDDGIPVRTTGEEGRLVDIPALQQGMLLEGGEGYREYRISLRLPHTELMPLVAFLQRLQESPQALRIDSLDISREPMRTATAARIDITRTVADAATETPASERDAATPDWEQLGLADWQTEGAVLRRVRDAAARDSAPILMVRAEAERGAAYRIMPIRPGASYDIYLDLQVTGEVRAAVADETGGMLLADPILLESGGELSRYHIQFSAPAWPAREVRMRAPALLLEGPDAAVTIHRMVLRRAE
mgnify:CR=1 FL=1